MDAYSDEDIKQAAEIRAWLVKQLADKQEEIERLRSTLLLIDSLLKQGSFKAASNFGSSATSPTSTEDVESVQTKMGLHSKDGGITYEVKANSTESNEKKTTVNSDSKVIKPLIRFKDSLLLANAEIYPDYVEIIPVKGIILNVNTPPFKSFFLNRILDGMKKKDEEAVYRGQIKKSDLLHYSVEDNDGLIKRIKINNYREKERLNEIFNTSSWVFTRMIEKSG